MGVVRNYSAQDEFLMLSLLRLGRYSELMIHDSEQEGTFEKMEIIT